MKPLLIVGDTLLDQDLEGRVERLAADAPVPVVDGVATRDRPGGAGLAACLAARAGCEVRLVTALCADDAGRRLRTLLEESGVEVLDVGRPGRTPQKIRVRAAGQTLLRLDKSDHPGRPGALPEGGAVHRAMQGAAAIVASDYGYGMLAESSLRSALRRAAARVPLVWDPHPRGPAPLAGSRLVTPNRREAGVTDAIDATRRARELRRSWQVDAVAVTLGADGAVLVADDAAPPLRVPAPGVADGDPCGAGDSFAAAAGRLLSAGASLEEAVEAAVACASEFVAEGGAAAAWGRTAATRSSTPGTGAGTLDSALSLATRVRSAGGRVIATGGCFDLLHAGHLQLLEAARGLGDALIVLVNSDRSVRSLKGPGRPVTGEADRVRLLSALRCVDAVAVFDESTPVEALRLLRPDVFAKGAEYAGRTLPEQDVLAECGGQLVLLPHLSDHSTTRLMKEMIHAGQ